MRLKLLKLQLFLEELLIYLLIAGAFIFLFWVAYQIPFTRGHIDTAVNDLKILSKHFGFIK